jgi:hypothetical protein
MDDHDILPLVQSAPFALNSPNPPANVEREIAARVLLRPEHRHSEPYRRKLNFEFGD